MSLSTILGLIPPVLQTWLFFLLVRRRLVRRFSFFFAYTVFAVLAEVLKGILLYRNSRGWAYFYVAWGAEALYAVLGFLAMVEVFQHVFANFFYLRWFKFLMPAVGAGMLGTSVLIAVVHPPVEASRWMGVVLSTQIAVRCLQLGMFFLTFMLARIFNLYYRQYAFGIAAGFGIAAIGILLGTLSRTHFGLRFLILFQYAPPVAYCLAVTVWVASFLRTEPADPFHDVQHLFTPELFLRRLEQYRQEIKRILKK